MISETVEVSCDMGVVPMDCHGACIVPLCKVMCNNYECNNSRGIYLLSVVGKR